MCNSGTFRSVLHHIGADSNTKKFTLAAILLFAVTMRIFFITQPRDLSDDAHDRYIPQALNLLAGNGFSKSSGPPYIPDTFEHNPGYAFFLAGIFFVTKNLHFLAFVHLILEMLTIYLIWLISGLLDLSQRARRLVILIALLCPLIAGYTREVLTEVLATFSIILTLYLILLCIKKDRMIFWVAAGLAFAFAWFVRTDLVLILALLGLCSTIFTRQIRKPAILLLTFVAAASPWIYRNYKISGDFIPISNLGRKHALPHVRWANTWVTNMKQHDLVAHRQGFKKDVDYAQLAQEQIKKSKIRAFFFVPVLRLINVLKDDLTHRLFSGRKLNPLPVIAYSTLILGILGMAIALYRREWILLLPLSIIIGRWILPMMNAFAMHFRILIESVPALYLFAGIAASAIYESVNKLFLERRSRTSSAQEKPISSETSDV